MSKGILLDFNLQLTRISRSCSENTLSESIINCFGSYGNSGGGKPMLKEIKNIIRTLVLTAGDSKDRSGRDVRFFFHFFHLAAFCFPPTRL